MIKVYVEAVKGKSYKYLAHWNLDGIIYTSHIYTSRDLREYFSEWNAELIYV